ncbi:alpha/beta fold hydrolase [Tamilnaduibacter salinus]|nr:alpha/beta hydrolase [Tamilnaduibacter salinus]
MSAAEFETSETPVQMPANGLRFCVETRGKPEGEPVMFVMGLAGQMTLWPDSLIDQYTRAGYRVILFDNRDIGLSSRLKGHVKGHPLKAMARYRLGLSVPAPYTLYDMADDLVGILDAMAIDSVHLFGISMGGMISQLVAGRYPERVRSATLVMTSANSPSLPMPKPALIWKLSGGGTNGHDEASVVERSVRFWQAIQSPDYPADLDEVAERVRSDYRRSYYPAGILRQTRAILGAGSLVNVTRQIRVPTTIIHGKDDPLVRPVAAEQLSHLIPHAHRHMIPGMGHDLPNALMPTLAGHSLDMIRG